MSDPSPQSSPPHQFTDQYDFQADFPGETLTYIESGRKASMIWTWTNGYRISVDSLQTWSNPDGTHCPVSDEERSEIVRRAVKYAREKQHVTLIVEP